MAIVDSWFEHFRFEVVDRLRRADWPEPGSGYWQDLKRVLVKHGATEDAALEALADLAEAPPQYAWQFIPALVEALKSVVRRQRERTIPIRPEPEADMSHAAWDAAAEANWARLSEAERTCARSLVRERLPEWVSLHPGWIEGLAKGWAFDPSMIANPPPPRLGPEPRGVKRFAHLAVPPFVDVPDPKVPVPSTKEDA